MKRLVLCLALLLVAVAAGPAAAEQSVTMDHVVNVWPLGMDTILADRDVQFMLRVTNTNGLGCKYNTSYNFQVYSPDGATWGSTEIDTTHAYGIELFDQFFTQSWSVTGSGADTVGLAALWMAMNDKQALYDGYDDVALSVTIHPDLASDGLTICLDTIGRVKPGYEWYWMGFGDCGDTLPDWGGPYCFTVVELPYDWPIFTPGNPTELEGSHCETFAADFDAYDPTPEPYHDTLFYYIASGPGEIDSVTGEWSWDAATLDDVGQPITLVVEACTPYLDQQTQNTSFTADTDFQGYSMGIQFSWIRRRSGVGNRAVSNQYNFNVFGRFFFRAGQ